MAAQKFKYNVINKFGKEEPWSGIFSNAKKADEWYEKHGKWHEQRGHKLIRVACSNSDRS
jgi:hypothetical protein